MNKKSDVFLRKTLKDWVKRQTPPGNGRARLLWEAARVSRNKIDLSVLLFRPQFKSYPLSSKSEWSLTLFSWINENSIQMNFQARFI